MITHEEVRALSGAECRIEFDFKGKTVTRQGKIALSKGGRKLVVTSEHVIESIPLSWIKSIGRISSTETRAETQACQEG